MIFDPLRALENDARKRQPFYQSRDHHEIAGCADLAGAFIAARGPHLVRTGLGDREERRVDEAVLQCALVALLVEIDAQRLVDTARNLAAAHLEYAHNQVNDAGSVDGRAG